MSRRGNQRSCYARSQEIARQAGAHLASARMQASPDPLTEDMREVLANRMTWDEAKQNAAARQVRSTRAKQAQAKGSRTPDPRANRPGPNDSRQWAQSMQTTSARDPRLTPGARVLLQVIVAEIGHDPSRILCNGYLAARLHVSPRTVQRYIKQLLAYGYINAETIASERTGLDIGRRIWTIATKVRPFWHRLRAASRGHKAPDPAGKTHAPTEPRSFRGTTKLTPTNSPSGYKDQSSGLEPDHIGNALARLGYTTGYKPG